MNHRDRISLLSLSLSFLISQASDKPNADVIARQTSGKVVATIPGTGDSVSYTPTNTGPMPVYEGQNTNNIPQHSSGKPSNSSAGGIFGFIYNLGKTSEKEKRLMETEEALRKAEQAARFVDNRVIAGKYGNNPIMTKLSPEQLAQVKAEEVAHAARNAKYLADKAEKEKMADLAKQAYTIATANKPAAIIATTPVPSGSSGPTNEQIVAAIKRLDAIKVPDTQTPGVGEALQGAGAAGAGGAAAYNAGVWGSIKAGGAYVVGGAKAAGTYVVAAACAHPYIAAGAAAATVIGGGLLYNHNKAKKARAVRESIVQHVQEVAASHDVKIIQVTGPRNTKNPKNSEIPHPEQNGDPRLRGITDPIIIQHAGQGNKPHGFKDQWGHWKEYNDKTHASTMECFKNGTYHGKNADGVHVITTTNPHNGGQEWVYYKDGHGITNSGINPMHMPIDPGTKLPYTPVGFAKPKGPGHGMKAAAVGAALGSSSSTSTGATYTAMDIPAIGIDARTGETFEIPNAPSDIPPMPTAEQLHKRKIRDIHAIENTLEEFEFRLASNLSKEEKHRQVVAAREFLAKQNDL